MIERIKKIMEFAELSPARFAEEIGINRAAMSHYLSGRNNPSLEVLNKILDVYSEINPIWLYRGFGEMFTDVGTIVNMTENSVNNLGQLPLFTDVPSEEISPNIEDTVEKQIPVVENISDPISAPFLPTPLPSSRIVTKIIVYYSDQTFEIFTKDQLPVF